MKCQCGFRTKICINNLLKWNDIKKIYDKIIKKRGVADMTIQQEVYEKIMRLPEDGIKLILVMADEIARQHGIRVDMDAEQEKSTLLGNKKGAFQNMLELREQSTYPQDFDYKKVMEEAKDEKYNFTN